MLEIPELDNTCELTKNNVENMIPKCEYMKKNNEFITFIYYC